MRHLNKIIFINSATIRYQEILIDGNVHFIGTQGAGKSTVLRAILFFYNADVNKLGIAKEKKSFADYYFPNSNSYLVYEVLRDGGSFSILAYKQSGRVAYRFIDSPYDPNFYIFENNAAEGWDKIRQKLDELGIDYSKKIDRYEEYRNIIYGNNEGKSDLKKYSLLESKLYQNIPRTIQNVFLNTKLEAEFIKKTIIDSLMEENAPIDLGIYRHHLQEFENEYKDIETFKNKKSQEKAEKIIEYHNHISKAKSEKIESYKLLLASAEMEQKKKPDLIIKIETQSKLYEEESNKLKDIERQHGLILTTLDQEKGGWQSKLDTAMSQKEKYQLMKIESIVERIEKEGVLNSKKSGLIQEQITITTAYKDIDQKYKLLTDQLENELREFDNIQGEKKIKFKQTNGTHKDEVIQSTEQKEKEINIQFKEKLSVAESTFKTEQLKLTNLEKDLIKVESTRFYEKEINNSNLSLSEIEKLISKNEAEIKVREAGKSSLSRELEHELELIENKFEINFSILKEQTNKTEDQLKLVNLWLENSNKALFGFLNKNYIGWEKTIGKICKEDLLFNTDLSPQLIEKSESLFGIKIDLSEINTEVKTLDGYNKEKLDLENKVHLQRKDFDQLSSDKLNEIEKARKRLLPKVREHTDAIQQLTYSNQQSTVKSELLQIEIKELEKKSILEKNSKIDSTNLLISESKITLQKSLENKNAVSDELNLHITNNTNERKEKIALLNIQLEKDLTLIENTINENKLNFNKRKDELSGRKHAELQGKGLDTQRLEVIEKELENISKELKYITDNKKLVMEYEIDIEQFISKIDEFRSNVSKKETEKKNEIDKHLKQKGDFISNLNAIRIGLEVLKKNLEETEEQIQQYENFRKSDEISDLAFADKENINSHNLLKVSEYITKFRTAHYSIIDKLNSLTTIVNDYSSKFSSNNIFNFKTGFVEQNEYLDFAITLKEFIDENKISEFEKRVNKRYGEIINLVDKEVTELISKEGDIQQVISKINKDFFEKNFVGAISVIEMRIEGSSNRIVDILKRIKAFNIDGQFNTFTSGPNLFTNDVDEKRIYDAINLLASLVKEIKESKSSTINISDSFELKFRIVENQNDSGWVEKLSNIGSEGTDILVKAMINIMLLNVFKESASRKLKEFKLHCVMDEIGRLHPSNVRGILNFATARNILLINGSPIEHDALAYKHVYELRKDQDKYTRIKRLITSKK